MAGNRKALACWIQCCRSLPLSLRLLQLELELLLLPLLLLHQLQAAAAKCNAMGQKAGSELAADSRRLRASSERQTSSETGKQTDRQATRPPSLTADARWGSGMCESRAKVDPKAKSPKLKGSSGASRDPEGEAERQQVFGRAH